MQKHNYEGICGTFCVLWNARLKLKAFVESSSFGRGVTTVLRSYVFLLIVKYVI